MDTKHDDVARNEISRREFLRLAGVAGGASLLAACGNAPATTGQASTPAAAGATVAADVATAAPAAEAPTPAAAAVGADAQVKLTMWTPGGSKVFCPTMWTNIMQAYNKANPGVGFEPVQCGTGDQSFEEVLLARIAAGNPPDATILWVSPIALGARGSLEALDDIMATSQNAQKDNWPEAVLASCQWQGKTYGLPVTAGTYGIWYNQEWFDKKGIKSDPKDFPKTWDDLRRLSKEFTHWNGDRLETAGFLPWHDANTLPMWSALNGGQIYDAKAQKYTIDAEPNIAMMEYIVSWLDEEYKGDITKVTKSGAWGGYPGEQGQPPAFQDQRLVMMLEGSWFMGDFYASIAPKFEKWNVAPLPVGPKGNKVVSGFWPNWLVIPKGSKQKAEAFKWLDYISLDGAKAWFATIPDLPANKKIPADLAAAVVVGKRGQAFANQLSQFFKNQLNIATPMWDSPVQNFAIDQLQRALDQIVNKKAKPKEALAEAQTACQGELEKVLKGAA